LAQLATLSEAELSPVASVLGGQVAQEVLKAVSRRDEPLKNVLVYDALVSEAVVRDLSPA
jgi:ubiquitin-like 1-activating enzyme E1 A